MQATHDYRQINSLTLIETAKIMGRNLPTRQRIHSVLKLLTKWANLYYSRILLPNYQSRELEVAYHHDLPEDKVKAGVYSVKFDQGLTGYVWRSGQVALVTDVLGEPLFLTRIAEPILGSKHHVGFICVPIIVDGKPIGVLSTQRRANPRRRYADDVDLLRMIASLIGPGLHQMQHRAQNISFAPDQLDRESGHWVEMCEAHGIIGSSRALLSAVKEVEQVKDSDAPVLLLGESGTGKEMFAGMIHRESKRHNKPFICINCASIPENLLESELFGHEKGSFTGAYKRQQGKIEQANEGTLFLDEIGDMPMDLQVKLLRVLQDKHIQPIGSDKPRKVNFRLITATHVDLSRAVTEGRFRLDLFYRLNVLPIALPALRERKADIPLLAQRFLAHYCEVYDRSISFTQGVHERLQHFSWEGNIRQLQNVIERAVLKSDGVWINVDQIDYALSAERVPGRVDEAGSEAANFSPDTDATATHAPSPVAEPRYRPYSRVEASDLDAIQSALKKTRGNQSEAARLLGYTPRQLRYRLKLLKTA